jgi:hypothetical protein
LRPGRSSRTSARSSASIPRVHEPSSFQAGTIDHAERAVEQRVDEPARALAARGLRRAHDDHRRRRVEATQELQDTRAGGFAADGGAVVEGQREVHHRDVHRDAADDVRCLDARAGLDDVHSMGTQDLRHGDGPCVLAPAARGEQQVEERRAAGRARPMTARAAEGGVVGRLGVEQAKAHARG